MVYDYEDFLEVLYEMHPEVNEKSINKIVKKGLTGINMIMRKESELILNTSHLNSGWIKFYSHMTPEEQNIRATRNFYKKKSKSKITDATKHRNVK